RIDQESAVARDIVLGSTVQIRSAAEDPRLKQSHRGAGIERFAFDCNRRRHQLSIRREVVQLLAVGPPAWIHAAGGGHLRLTARACHGRLRGFREWPYVYFVAPGFVRQVSDPAPVGRERPVGFIESGSQKDKRTFSSCQTPFSSVGILRTSVRSIRQEK